MSDEKQPTPDNSNEAVIRERVETFQSEYKELCVKHGCTHRPILNANQFGILPSFVVTVSPEAKQDELGEGLVEPDEPKK